MKFPVILVADLHLTSNPRDEYRWGLWPWLRDQLVKERARSLCLLGDLTDAKDFHPSSLVNRVASEVRQTAECRGELLDVFMIPGNHEWLKQGEEFWRFLNFVHPSVRYMVAPTEVYTPDVSRVYFLPFTKDPRRDWRGMNFEDYDYVFMHQTLKGAVASNGQEMAGEDLPTDQLAAAGKVWSGDIHVPQRIGCVEYVGSPYHVHFGDDFVPRVVLIEGRGKPAIDLHFPSPRRVMKKITDPGELDGIPAGSQVKVVVTLPEAEKHLWQAIRRDCMKRLGIAGVELFGIELKVQRSERRILSDTPGRSSRRSAAEDVMRFVRAEELTADALDVALGVIEP